MRFIAFIVYMTAMIAIAMLTLGCSAENPVCSTNFCAVGEVFPRSELDTDTFSEVDIDDSMLLASLVGVPMPVETTHVETVEAETAPVTLADIVSDVAKNGTSSGFIGQTVEIEGTVHFNLVVRSNKGGISLVTEYQNIFFYVTDFDTPLTLLSYAEGQTYTFKLVVRQVLRSTTDAGVIYIYSHEVE